MLHYTNYHSHSHKFANTEILEMYAYQVLKGIAFGLVGIFVAVYLYTAGVAIHNIVALFALGSFIHGLICLLFVRGVLFKIGIKHTFIIATLGFIASFLVIRQGVSPSYLILWALLDGIANAFYASAYHSFVALNMDEQIAGKEVALLSIFTIIINIITPVVGSFLILIFGFEHMFLIGSILLIFSVVPLFLSAETRVTNQIRLSGFAHIKKYRTANKKIFWSTIGNGLDASSDPMWDALYMYKIVGGLKNLGILKSIFSFLQIFAFYFGGKRMDEKKSVFNFGINGSIMARMLTFVSFYPFVAIMSETANSIVRPFFATSYAATWYKEIRGSYAISHVVAHENIWHLAHAGAMGVIALGAYFFGWYSFLLAGAFMIIGKFIIKKQQVGA